MSSESVRTDLFWRIGVGEIAATLTGRSFLDGSWRESRSGSGYVNPKHRRQLVEYLWGSACNWGLRLP